MIRHILPGALLVMASFGAQAETVSMPDARAAGAELPGRGLSMDVVEEQFGAPARVLDAVGEPPITRWVYPDFTVYFEHQFVIHPVVRTRHTGHPVGAN
ncbi:MAG: hypothetical protein OET44_01955 [Gammaproteobacteria bacterium]|nr:hypothetical protein [Gammaproteobacteria bacterium]